MMTKENPILLLSCMEDESGEEQWWWWWGCGLVIWFYSCEGKMIITGTSEKRHAARRGRPSKSRISSLPEHMIDLYNSVRFQHDLWNYRVTRNSMLARNSETS